MVYMKQVSAKIFLMESLVDTSLSREACIHLQGNQSMASGGSPSFFSRMMSLTDNRGPEGEAFV